MHLNRCPEEGRTRLFKEGAEMLEKWLQQDGKTKPELAHWLPNFIDEGATAFHTAGVNVINNDAGGLIAR